MSGGEKEAGGVGTEGLEANSSHAAAAGVHPGWRRGWGMRLHLLYLLSVLWALALGGQLMMVMVWQRGDEQRRGVVWHVGTMPAIRGRLLDASGAPLAWSTRHMALCYKVPADGAVLASDLAKLADSLPLDPRLAQRLYEQADRTVVLRPDLSAAELFAVSKLVADHPRLRVQSQFRRQVTTLDQGSLGLLGQTQVYGQRELGISGWELEYDAKLRGDDGRFRVQVDRQGQWIAASWQEIRPPMAGRDVYLPVVINPGRESTAPGLASRR